MIATGTPEDVAAVAGSHTGSFLAELLEASPPAAGAKGKRRRREPVAA